MLLFAGALFSAGAIAQSTHVKEEKMVLKNTIKDKKEDKHEMGKDLGKLKISKAIEERKEVRHHRWSIRRQGRHLRNKGVKHPIEKAKHEAKVDKDKKDN